MSSLQRVVDVADESSAAPSRPARSVSRGGDRQPPRTDLGTIILHWSTAVAMVVSLATGLRIAADSFTSIVGRALEPVLPQGEIWTWHFLSSLALFFCSTAYVVYMVRGGLTPRVALARVRLLVTPGAGRMRWNAVNVILHWALYLAVAVLTATGIALYLGHGGWIVTVHSVLASTMIAYIVVHTVTHFLYGGWPQILRLFRPSALSTGSARSRPLLAALALGLVIALGIYGADLWTRDRLTVVEVATPPRLDGILDDPAWAASRPVSVATEQGSGLAGAGTSRVDVRAVRHADRIYFAFRWEDPTRSLARVPVIKREDGWHLLASRADIADVVDYYEDKFAVLFSHSDAQGNGGTTHLGKDTLPGMPKALHGRGYHFTTDGKVADVWQWKASRGGLIGRVDDMYFGPPNKPTDAMLEGKARYQAGYDADPDKAPYFYIYKGQGPGGYRGPVELVRLPKDPAAASRALGRIPQSPDDPNDENSRWFIAESDTVPYSKDLDAGIPVGTVLPGVIIKDAVTGDRGDVTGAATWKDGHWTLEATRRLKTGSPYDIDFTSDEPIYLYVSVFDHNQTRHTRHMRPIVLDLGSPR
jgi:cytochrome b subunit of formate dehydrogenase